MEKKKDKMRIYTSINNFVNQNASDVVVTVEYGNVRISWDSSYMSFDDIDEAEKLFKKILKKIQDSKFTDSKNSLWSTTKDK